MDLSAVNDQMADLYVRSTVVHYSNLARATNISPKRRQGQDFPVRLPMGERSVGCPVGTLALSITDSLSLPLLRAKSYTRCSTIAGSNQATASGVGTRHLTASDWTVSSSARLRTWPLLKMVRGLGRDRVVHISMPPRWVGRNVWVRLPLLHQLAPPVFWWMLRLLSWSKPSRREIFSTTLHILAGVVVFLTLLRLAPILATKIVVRKAEGSHLLCSRWHSLLRNWNGFCYSCLVLREMGQD